MLKMFLGFLVSVVVLLSSAYVAPVPVTYATSTDILITHIQAGGVGAATQEFIVIYNNSPLEVDITGWCLTNKSNATIACFYSRTGQTLYIPAYKHAVAVSNTYPTNSATVTYEPISQSSGSMTASADKISLIDINGGIVDQHSWTSSILGGMHFERLPAEPRPMVYHDTDYESDWVIVPTTTIPTDETWGNELAVDVCPNIEGDQSTIPIGKQMNEVGECIDQIVPLLDITELLPNAHGSDAGQEFIELYNPNDYSVDLSEYRLYVGPQYDTEYLFPAGSTIEAYSYKTFSNTEIPYSLLNTSSKVAVAHHMGIVVSEVPAYQDPKDGQSWSLIDTAWQYTMAPTPGLANTISIEDVVEKLETTLQVCAANQYRSPETNRCRLISSSIETVTACKDGQYRSEETNRCRNIASDTKTITPCDEDEERNTETNRCRKIVVATQPAPCKEGQERSPETNRCRTIAKMSNADYGVLGAETKSNGTWYVFAAVGGIVLVALGYAVWEWRSEIRKFFRKVRSLLTRR